MDGTKEEHLAIETMEDSMARWMETALAAATTTGLVTGLMGWMVILAR